MQNWVFLHTLFLENEAQIERNNYGLMLFMSKLVSLPKISSILQKLKIGQKLIQALFAQRPSIIKQSTDTQGITLFSNTVTWFIERIAKNLSVCFALSSKLCTN